MNLPKFCVWKVLLFLFITCFSTHIRAEGTAQAAPNNSISISGTDTSDVADLYINDSDYNYFAWYNNPDSNARLYFHLSDPSREVVYFGFSQPKDGSQQWSSEIDDAYFLIRKPDGTIIENWAHLGDGQRWSLNAANANITSRSQAMAGPSTILGTVGGYNPFIFDPLALGITDAGDYYIEFVRINSSGVVIEEHLSISLWDITVATRESSSSTSTGNPMVFTNGSRDARAIPGRVWSYNWALFAPNDFGFPERPFNGSFHVLAPAPLGNYYVTKIDFNSAGFRPAAFNIAFNSSGTARSGNITEDRKSQRNLNSTAPEYRVFLNNPDPVVWPSGSFGQTFSNDYSLSRCSSADLCINVSSNQPGQYDVLIDLAQDGSGGKTGEYDPGTRDVVLAYQVSGTATGTDTAGNPIWEACIPWDGNDGLGVLVPVSDLVNLVDVYVAFSQGAYHFPIFDAEYNSSGFTTTNIRPEIPGGGLYVPNLFWDDSKILADPDDPIGFPDPSRVQVELEGCPSPCHSWDNYSNPDTVGFGNLNTINTWWFAYREQVPLQSLAMPDYLVMDLGGSSQTVCIAGPVNLGASLTYSLGGTYLNGIWSGGEGTFFPSATAFDAQYFPSNAELLAETVTLRFTSTGECAGLSDTVQFTLANDPISCANFPVELLELSARLDGRDGIVEWTTALEVNNAGFVVERSVDNLIFESLHTIEGAGNTTEKRHYKFRDPNVAVLTYPKVFYRLKQLDFNGDFTYSETLEVILDVKNILVVYPNPARESVFVRYELDLNKDVQIVITNSAGQVVEQRTLLRDSGIFEINLGDWAPGIYCIQSINGISSEVYKFVVE